MGYSIARGSEGPIRDSEVDSNPRYDARLWCANRLEMLVAASSEIGGCPAWVIMELEAGELAFDQERRKS